MYKLSKDYKLLHELIQKDDVACFVDYDFRRNATNFVVRDICRCKKLSFGDILFTVRGCEYGGVCVMEYENKISPELELKLFIEECNRLNVEFVPF